MIQANETYYRENAAAFTAAIRKLQQKSNGMSLLRLLVFVSLVWCVYDLVQHYSLLLLVLALAQAGLFVFFINIHYGWKDKRRLLERLRFVSENELRLLAGKPTAFRMVPASSTRATIWKTWISSAGIPFFICSTGRRPSAGRAHWRTGSVSRCWRPRGSSNSRRPSVYLRPKRRIDNS